MRTRGDVAPSQGRRSRILRGPAGARPDGVGSAILPAVTEDITPSAAGGGRKTQRSGPTAGLVVALDGPSSSGKSTVGAEAARRLGYRFCDTGLLYRATAWLAMKRDVAPTRVPELLGLVEEVRLEADEHGRFKRVRAAGEDVTGAVRGEAVDGFVSEYARVPELRLALLDVQRNLAAEGSIIMAGRDIGTVILPDADVKIYLDASAEERARRRAAQRRTAAVELEQAILRDLQRRDAIDSTRETAPLRLARDAIVIHSDGMDFRETVRAVVDVIKSAEAARAATSDGRGLADPTTGGADGR
jgi:cytidylate kinase